ncbi:MAG: tetratricopeptide repeat protein [Desulfovibrionaceae bacterium]
MVKQNEAALRRQNERTIFTFVKTKGGVFVAVTEDGVFLRVLRSTVYRHLSLQGDHIVHLAQERTMLSSLAAMREQGVPMVVYVDRIFRGKKTYAFIKKAKEIGGDLKIVVLTGPAGPESLIMCYEMGADNLIFKPVSVNTLIAKTAVTLQPPGKAEQLLEAGTTLLSEGDAVRAQGLARYLLELNPRSAAAYVLLGDSLHLQGQRDAALEAYQLASEHARMYLKPLKRLAELYSEEGDNATGLSYLEKLDAINPYNMDRKVDMGDLNVKLGNEKEAESLFEAAVRGASDEMLNYAEEISRRIADVYSEYDPARAERYYRRTLESRSTRLSIEDIAIFNQLGLTLRRQGKWKEAVVEYKKAMKIAPKDENLAYNAAMAYAEGGRFFEASECIHAALELNPEFHRHEAGVAYNIAVIFAKLDDPRTAHRFLDVALQLDPDFAKARELLQSLAA